MEKKIKYWLHREGIVYPLKVINKKKKPELKSPLIKVEVEFKNRSKKHTSFREDETVGLMGLWSYKLGGTIYPIRELAAAQAKSFCAWNIQVIENEALKRKQTFLRKLAALEE